MKRPVPPVASLVGVPVSVYFDDHEIAAGAFVIDPGKPARVLFKGDVRLTYTAEPGAVLVRIGADVFRTESKLSRERSGRYHGRAQHKTADAVARCWFNVSRIGGPVWAFTVGAEPVAYRAGGAA